MGGRAWSAKATMVSFSGMSKGEAATGVITRGMPRVRGRGRVKVRVGVRVRDKVRVRVRVGEEPQWQERETPRRRR